MIAYHYPLSPNHTLYGMLM
uniref:Uncharacterized protein n=1 Tax=Arundo donax TaxID=35708 RepID=A0A0A8ZUX9_ARUDO